MVIKKQKVFIVGGGNQLTDLNQLLEKGWYVKDVTAAPSSTFWLVVAEQHAGADKPEQ